MLQVRQAGADVGEEQIVQPACEVVAALSRRHRAVAGMLLKEDLLGLLGRRWRLAIEDVLLGAVDDPDEAALTSR